MFVDGLMVVVMATNPAPKPVFNLDQAMKLAAETRQIMRDYEYSKKECRRIDEECRKLDEEVKRVTAQVAAIQKAAHAKRDGKPPEKK